MDAHLADHLLFAVLVALPPLLGRSAYLRLRDDAAAGVPRVRLHYYRRTVAIQWLVAAFVVALWLIAGRSARGLGLLPWRGGLAAAVGLALAAPAALALLFQYRRLAGRPDRVADARRQVEPLLDLLPHDAREDRWFAALSLTAGVCEEVVYRGFVIAYLASGVGWWPAAALSALVFGIGHAYQGVAGMVKTGIAGAVAAVLYVGSGWLLPAMLLHAAADLGSARVVRAVRAVPRPDEPAADPV